MSADSIFHWTDKQGQAHFSDSAPPAGAHAEERVLVRESQAPAQGLRPGERRNLQAYQARRDRLRQQAASRALRATRQLEQQRNSCRSARERLRAAEQREQRKQQGSYLRQHCW